MRLFVIGGAGQLGRAIVERATARGDEVIAGYRGRPLEGVASVPIDKGDAASVDQALAAVRPEAVIDTGALHHVDYCELHPDEADRINAEGSRRVAEATRRVGGRTLFVSTDFVFGDDGRSPHSENDPANPVSAYGRSKRAGEQAVLSVDGANLVARPSVIYSWIPRGRRSDSASGKPVNFGCWLVDEVARGNRVRIVTDQRASPTLSGDLAGALLALLDRAPGGIYHTAGATPASRFDFSVALVRRVGLDARLVDPVLTSSLAQKARRPRDSSLDSRALASTTGYQMSDLDAQTQAFAAEYLADIGTSAPSA